MRVPLRSIAGLLLATLLLAPLMGMGRDEGEVLSIPPVAQDPPTTPDEVCATGCAAAPLGFGFLAREEFEALLADFAEQPPSEHSEALEALLFYGKTTRTYLETLGSGDLDAERAAFLRRELARTHARVDVRLIDENGVERLRLGTHRVPVGEKQHLHPERTHRLQPPEVSGTVQRVGLRHLWARL